MFVLGDVGFWEFMDALDEDTLVVVTSPTCGACLRLKVALDQMDLDIQCVELDAVEGPGVIEELEVFHLPALFLFRDGDVYAEVQAELSPEALASAIRAAQAGPPQDL